MPDRSRADALLGRQMVLLVVTALVVPLLLGGVGLALSYSSARSQAWAIAASLLACAVAVVVLAVNVRHLVRLAGFAFRRKDS